MSARRPVVGIVGYPHVVERQFGELPVLGTPHSCVDCGSVRVWVDPAERTDDSSGQTARRPLDGLSDYHGTGRYQGPGGLFLVDYCDVEGCAAAVDLVGHAQGVTDGDV